jgi:hypothetical protein
MPQITVLSQPGPSLFNAALGAGGDILNRLGSMRRPEAPVAAGPQIIAPQIDTTLRGIPAPQPLFQLDPMMQMLGGHFPVFR